MTSAFFKDPAVAQIAQLYRITVFIQENICSFQVSMDDANRVQVCECLENLLCVLSANRLAKSTVAFTEINNAAPAHVLQVDAKHVIVCDFTPVVVDYVSVKQQLEPVYFMFQSFDF